MRVRQHLHVDAGLVHVGQTPLAQLAQIRQPARRHPLARGVGRAEIIARLADLLVHALATIVLFQRDQSHSSDCKPGDGSPASGFGFTQAGQGIPN